MEADKVSESTEQQGNNNELDKKFMKTLPVKSNKSPKRSPSKVSTLGRSPRKIISKSPGRPATRSPGRPVAKSPTRSPGRLGARSPGRPVTRSPGRQPARSPGRSVTRSPGRPVAARSPGRSVTRSPGRPVTRSPGRPVAKSPGRPVTRSPGRPTNKSPGRPVTRSPGRPVAKSPARPSTRSPGRPAKSPARLSGKSPVKSNKDQDKPSNNPQSKPENKVENKPKEENEKPLIKRRKSDILKEQGQKQRQEDKKQESKKEQAEKQGEGSKIKINRSPRINRGNKEENKIVKISPTKANKPPLTRRERNEKIGQKNIELLKKDKEIKEQSKDQSKDNSQNKNQNDNDTKADPDTDTDTDTDNDLEINIEDDDLENISKKKCCNILKNKKQIKFQTSEEKLDPIVPKTVKYRKSYEKKVKETNEDEANKEQIQEEADPPLQFFDFDKNDKIKLSKNNKPLEKLQGATQVQKELSDLEKDLLLLDPNSLEEYSDRKLEQIEANVTNKKKTSGDKNTRIKELRKILRKNDLM